MNQKRIQIAQTVVLLIKIPINVEILLKVTKGGILLSFMFRRLK